MVKKQKKLEYIKFGTSITSAGMSLCILANVLGARPPQQIIDCLCRLCDLDNSYFAAAQSGVDLAALSDGYKEDVVSCISRFAEGGVIELVCRDGILARASGGWVLHGERSEDWVIEHEGENAK